MKILYFLCIASFYLLALELCIVFLRLSKSSIKRFFHVQFEQNPEIPEIVYGLRHNEERFNYPRSVKSYVILMNEF